MQNRNNPATLHAPILSAINLPWGEAASIAKKVKVPAQSWLVPDGDLDFFYIVSGKVTIMHTDAEGRERAIFRLDAGNIFNEAPAAAGFDAPNSPFFCQEACVLYKFSASLLHDMDFISTHPELVSNLIKGLGIKLLIMHTSLSNFTGTNALARVCRFFFSLASRQGSLDFDPSLSQESLAILLGMNRATIVRALKELRDCGAIIKYSKRRLVIGDLELLHKLAESVS